MSDLIKEWLETMPVTGVRTILKEDGLLVRGSMLDKFMGVAAGIEKEWSELEELKARLKEAEDVIKFYGDNDTSWEAAVLPSWNGRATKIINQDVEEIGQHYFGGKRAREYMNKYGGKDE